MVLATFSALASASAPAGEVNNGAGQTQMSTIALIDTRLKIPGESVAQSSVHIETIRAAFKANEAFQKRMRGQRREGSRPHENVTVKVRLGAVSMVNPGVHLFQEGEKSGAHGGFKHV